MVKLDILSDPICPWCFIGWTYLARALEARPARSVDIEWHPYRLNPDMPEEGMDRRAYLEGKFGGREGAARAYAPVIEAAEAAGLSIDFDAIARTPNTLDAHRVLHWARSEGRQTPMSLALFRAYFQDGRDIGDPDTLAGLAADAGLDRAMIATRLAGAADAETIAARDTRARMRGVGGVPTFVIANRHVLRGAQPPGVWTQAIDDIARRAPA